MGQGLATAATTLGAAAVVIVVAAGNRHNNRNVPVTVVAKGAHVVVQGVERRG